MLIFNYLKLLDNYICIYKLIKTIKLIIWQYL